MRDPGLAVERTVLSRRRTTIPFLVVALLGARAAVDVPVQGFLVTALAAVGAIAAIRRAPTALAVLVVALALAALSLPAVDPSG